MHHFAWLQLKTSPEVHNFAASWMPGCAWLCHPDPMVDLQRPHAKQVCLDWTHPLHHVGRVGGAISQASGLGRPYPSLVIREEDCRHPRELGVRLVIQPSFNTIKKFLSHFLLFVRCGIHLIENVVWLGPLYDPPLSCPFWHCRCDSGPLCEPPPLQSSLLHDAGHGFVHGVSVPVWRAAHYGSWITNKISKSIEVQFSVGKLRQ